MKNWFNWLLNSNEVHKQSSQNRGAEPQETEQMLAAPKRPFLLKAYYEWIVANDCTPLLMISTSLKDVRLPSHLKESPTVALNIAPLAIRDLEIKEDHVSFTASFSGQAESIYLPIASILSIHAQENEQGAIFEQEDFSKFHYNKKQDLTERRGPTLVVNNAAKELTPPEKE